LKETPELGNTITWKGRCSEAGICSTHRACQHGDDEFNLLTCDPDGWWAGERSAGRLAEAARGPEEAGGVRNYRTPTIFVKFPKHWQNCWNICLL